MVQFYDDGATTAAISLIFFLCFFSIEIDSQRIDPASEDRFQLENIYSDQFKFIFKFINIIIV